MFCNIINNKIVNPSNFEGERKFKLDYDAYISAPKNYFIYDVNLDDITINPNYFEEENQKKTEQFNKDFFNTSLGYVRRKVTMKDGSKKDFLSDLLPVITMAVNMGQKITVITYEMPDFNDLKPIEEYQHNSTVTPEFIQECFQQLSNDFI